ncbi:hypothetical protein [Ligilactobacillus ruminis]|uniref:Uncharacterized protein n=1 Tax=Ligilactobacillus ruminis SPM0211 TaxID=1040964 RepID=F7QZ34_9LACO|nr:hypothetical protein [Ligilactobacillus ruminis]EGM53540.1 hypothetical protein LRU_00676 [Ligilactobacillus ruminis SPM0211]EGX97438.1 hypothetical protein ANHS_1981 [Ligilactobacillus ruminis ATCC 25644]MBS7037532.1 hypothetical protein [Ligilactobacillus ruminis]MDB7641683.1 hypothetical protein [Ligilactobacillus ruminis]MDB7648331.1 hypothetical protein [Ligilactobacillus ruminis]
MEKLIVWSVIDVLLFVSRSFFDSKLISLVFVFCTIWVFVLFVGYAIQAFDCLKK